MSQVPICPTHNLPMHQDNTQLTTPLVCAQCQHESYQASLQQPSCPTCAVLREALEKITQENERLKKPARMDKQV